MMIMTHEFVEHMPENLDEGIIYVSIPFETVIHKCVCGCGNEVVTPLSPAEWSLTFDGETISLYPSIGNWSLDCKSHYWIRENKIKWSSKWSEEEIETVRLTDFLAKKVHFEKTNQVTVENTNETTQTKKKNSFWDTFLSLFK